MRVSASFCREQQASQIDKAANEPLENRRKIALAAAMAWGAEVILAEKRALKLERLDKLDAEIALEFANETETFSGD
ncbi:MAG: hypothetical protein KA482_10930 [Sphingobium sp.]|nr:hypothetical protein [Sphingobium sp.]MBP8672057.1 hypothetical protein [Sphingobium sp.]MBP9158940.1 hypothetical protein [Sphingobium sp.]MCC6482245.1 hypothetical protein [Sphingomonadaceae bacterium]